jgi:23S rRNA pseudouridine2605 synthase
MENNKIRIAKFIADAGAASKRDAERLIAAGRVTVNGHTIGTPVFFVDGSEKIAVDGADIRPREKTHVFAFHKPVNTLTSFRDPMGRKTIYDVLPEHCRNLKYVGRLDFKTTGLLLLTDDGGLARALTLPSSKIPRVYHAETAMPPQPIDTALAPARRGMTVDGIRYQAMRIDRQRATEKTAALCLTLVEGKKNEIRIVLSACGMPVRRLHRVSYGAIRLGDLGPGDIRKLSDDEIKSLLKSGACS